MLCLVDRSAVEVEWQIPLVRVRAFIPYWFAWNDLRIGTDGRWFNMRLGEATRGKWRIPDERVRVVYFYIRTFEGSSHHLCRLRTDHLAPMSKFDFVLTHTWFMGCRKLSSFDGRWVGRHSTTLVVMYTRIVYMPPTDSLECSIAWKTCTRARWARLNCLIVVMNCGRSWCLREPRVSCCQVVTL
jgi:hypothetical protein